MWAKKGANAMNYKEFTIDSAKSLRKVGLQSAQRHTMDFRHN